MRLNKEELWTGAVYAVVWWYFLKWWSLLAIPLCSLYWAVGGAKEGHPLWRRLGIPVALSSFIYLGQGYYPFWWIPILPAYGVLTMGYGLPDGIDKGSPLGRFWMKQCGNNMAKADIMTRGTLALLFGICFLPLAFINLEMWCAACFSLTIFSSTITNCIE